MASPGHSMVTRSRSSPQTANNSRRFDLLTQRISGTRSAKSNSPSTITETPTQSPSTHSEPSIHSEPSVEHPAPAITAPQKTPPATSPPPQPSSLLLPTLPPSPSPAASPASSSPTPSKPPQDAKTRSPSSHKRATRPSVPDFQSGVSLDAPPSSLDASKRQRTSVAAASVAPSLFSDVMKYLDEDSLSQPPLPAAPSRAKPPPLKSNKKAGGRAELMTSSQREKMRTGVDLPMLYCDLDPSSSRHGDSVDSAEYLISSDSSKSNLAAPAALPIDVSTASPKKTQLSWDTPSRSSLDLSQSDDQSLSTLKKHSVLKVNHVRPSSDPSPQTTTLTSLWSEIQKNIQS